jgi:hypothetical protein
LIFQRKNEVTGDGKSWNTARIGTGIYPALALLNHSCNPNILKYFNGSTVVAVASRTIFKGNFFKLLLIKSKKILIKII